MGVARLYSYSLKTSAPRWPLRQGFLLQYNEGWGEVAPLPGFSRESLTEALEEIHTFFPRLASATPRLPSVRFGLRQALSPFLKTPLKQPLCLLNEPRPRFSTLKLKLAHLPLDDAIAYVQRHVGKFRLRLDCNRAWTLEEALLFARHFSPRDFEYLEEPLQNNRELPLFSNLTRFPIALDESPLQEEIPTLAGIVVKPTLKATPRTKIPLIFSSAYETSLGLLQIARLGSRSKIPLGLDTFRYFEEDILVPPLRAEEGFILWNPSQENPIDVSKLTLLRESYF